MTIELVNEIRWELGLDESRDSAYLDMENKRLLAHYQKNNGLPVGQLNFETLEHLGIAVWGANA